MRLSELVPILQLAIGPVILISGVGLLLLSMTNRFGRVIDRSRQLAEALRNATPSEGARLLAQLRILSRRARLVRLTIGLAALSLLLAAVLIIVLFLTALFGWEATFVIVLAFIACMLALIGSLLGFILDINLSLAALELEISATGDPGERGPEKAAGRERT